ncbi:MAG: hypothetical protein HY238_20645, partial [Acidobacteria bacterium]|nr:hypothetical protein [Acidobacteriota bacterium]
QAYGARGNGIFERAVLDARPWSKLSFTGQFLYSKPRLDVNYLQQNSGNFILLDTLQIYTGQLDRSLAEANRPRSSGSWTTEIRPVRRVRVLESWFTDRSHVSAASFLARTLAVPATNLIQTQASITDRLVLNLNQHQVDAIVDVAPSLTLRGGHRYEWGDAVSLSSVRLVPGAETAELRRQVALAGATWRRGANLDFNADVEASAGDHTFFRTDLADYQRARLRGRYRARPWMAWTATFAILNNQNPARGVTFDYQSRQSSVALALTPRGGARWSLLLDYMRGTVRSTLPYLVPQDRTPEISRYRDDGHYGGASAEIHLWRGALLNLGGSFALVTGSRPTRYYQPHGRFQVPIRGKVAWTSEWRWFGFTERRYAFENFHANLFSMGLHIGL